MGNVYMLAKINGKVVDLTDERQVMVHGAENFNKASEMLKTMNIEEVGEYFCPSCGCYKPNKQECKCMSD